MRNWPTLLILTFILICGRQTLGNDSERLANADIFFPLLKTNTPSLIDFSKATGTEVKKNILKLPFGSKSSDRAILDCEMIDNATKTDFYYIDVETDIPNAPVGIPTLFLRSGNGWYVLSGNVFFMNNFKQLRMVFNVHKRKLSMYKPDRLDQIIAVRVSIPRTCNFDYSMKFLSLHKVVTDKTKPDELFEIIDKWKALLDYGNIKHEPYYQYRLSRVNKLLPDLRKAGYETSNIADLLKNKNSKEQLLLFGTLLDRLMEKSVKEFAQTVPYRDNEARFFWESAGTGLYPGDWNRTMKLLSDHGFNGVLPIMLWGGSALYPSQSLPKHSLCEKYGDQMEQAVKAAKKYGVQLHPRRICFKLIGTSNEFITKMRKAGRTQKSLDGKEIEALCPSLDINRKLEVDLMLEMATKYEVDGIHFDFIRYGSKNECFCDRCQNIFQQRYLAKYGKKLKHVVDAYRNDKNVQIEYNKWRVELITDVVKSVHERVKKECPKVKISAAVFYNWPYCVDSVAQDWGQWVNKGYLDFVCPMNYTNNLNIFELMCTRQIKAINNPKCPLYPGIGLYADDSTQTVTDSLLQVEKARALGLNGFCIFNLRTDAEDKVLSFYSLGATKKKCAFPNN